MRKVSKSYDKVSENKKSRQESLGDSKRLLATFFKVPQISVTLAQISDTFRIDYKCSVIGVIYTWVELSISPIKSRCLLETTFDDFSPNSFYFIFLQLSFILVYTLDEMIFVNRFSDVQGQSLQEYFKVFWGERIPFLQCYCI